jgi:GTP cyclohydrolase I
MAPIDIGRVEAAVAEVLAAIGEDVSRPGLAGTPQRVAQSYADFFGGVGQDPTVHLADAAELVADADELSELVLVRGIAFRSMCEHHLLPFTGVAHIAYVPRTRIVGLGKLPKVVETVSSRPQVQERLTEEIADALVDGLDPLGVLVVIDAAHTCVTTRGARQSGSTTLTLASRGVLSDPVRRSETVALIGSQG